MERSVSILPLGLPPKELVRDWLIGYTGKYGVLNTTYLRTQYCITYRRTLYYITYLLNEPEREKWGGVWGGGLREGVELCVSGSQCYIS